MCDSILLIALAVVHAAGEGTNKIPAATRGVTYWMRYGDEPWLMAVNPHLELGSLVAAADMSHPFGMSEQEVGQAQPENGQHGDGRWPEAHKFYPGR